MGVTGGMGGRPQSIVRVEAFEIPEQQQPKVPTRRATSRIKRTREPGDL